jgi:hypothetical protein
MSFPRAALGIAIAAAGFLAVLAIFVAFLLLPANHSPLVRVSSVMILVLIEIGIGFGTYRAYGRVMDSTPRDHEGG